MNSFHKAILTLKSAGELRDRVEAQIEGAVSFRILGAGREDLRHQIAGMASSDEDLGSPEFGVHAAACDRAITLVGMLEARPVSHASLVLIDEGGGAWPGQHARWLDTLFVAADHRGNGIGRQTADAIARLACQILDTAQGMNPKAWEHMDAHIDGDTIRSFGTLLRRMNDITVPHADALAERMIETEDLASAEPN